jgi:hypothetical protein
MATTDMEPYKYRPLGTPAKGGFHTRVLTLLPGYFNDDIHVIVREISLPLLPVSSVEDLRVSTENSVKQPADLQEIVRKQLEVTSEHGQNGDIDRSEESSQEGRKEFSGLDGLISARSQYEALSYVWGPTDDVELITVDNRHQYLSVTRNLASALRHLRGERRSRRLWIDAICINQRDLDERSSQTSTMWAIYHCAELVLVWLGEEKDHGREMMERLYDLGRDLVLNRTLDWNRKTMITVNGVGPPMPDLCLDEAALLKFLFRPWFERVWIRQEIAFAKKVIMHCGYGSRPLEPISDAVFVLANFAYKVSVYFHEPGLPERLRLVYETLSSARASISSLRRERYSLSKLRNTLKGVRSTDPRDQIYGVWSLLGNDFHALGIRVNYAISENELIIDVVSRFMQAGFLSSVLGMSASPAAHLETTPHPRLPSWVPDLTSDSTIATGLPPSDRISKPSTEILATSDGRMALLRVAGRHVETLSDVFRFAIPHEENSLSNSIKEAWGFALGQETFFRRYPEENPRFSAFFEAVGYDGTSDLELKLREVLEFPEVTALYKFLVRGLPLELSKVKLVRLRDRLNGRAFLVTESGRVGLGNIAVKKGDFICYLLGCSQEIILRPGCDESGRFRPSPGQEGGKTNPDSNRGNSCFSLVGPAILKDKVRAATLFGPLPNGWLVVPGGPWKSKLLFQRISHPALMYADPRVWGIAARLAGGEFDVGAYMQECEGTMGEPEKVLLTAGMLERAGIEIEYFDIV